MNNFNNEQITELDLRGTPYTKKMILDLVRMKYDQRTKFSNKFLKNELLHLFVNSKMEDLFVGGFDVKNDAHRQILTNYVKWMYQDAADFSHQSLIQEWVYLQTNGELESLVIAEWVFSESRWELGL